MLCQLIQRRVHHGTCHDGVCASDAATGLTRAKAFCARHADHAELRVLAIPTAYYVRISKVSLPLGQRIRFLLLQSRAVYALNIDLMSDVTRLCQPHHVSRFANAEALLHGYRGLNDLSRARSNVWQPDLLCCSSDATLPDESLPPRLVL